MLDSCGCVRVDVASAEGMIRYLHDAVVVMVLVLRCVVAAILHTRTGHKHTYRRGD